jgi:hypothetical protein
MLKRPALVNRSAGRVRRGKKLDAGTLPNRSGQAMIRPHGLRRMSDDPAQLRLKAEACRRLADLSGDTARKDVWLKRAADWDQLAGKAEKQLRTVSRYRAYWPVE